MERSSPFSTRSKTNCLLHCGHSKTSGSTASSSAAIVRRVSNANFPLPPGVPPGEGGPERSEVPGEGRGAAKNVIGERERAPVLRRPSPSTLRPTKWGEGGRRPDEGP